MSREELLAQMAASINYILEEAHAEVYPKRTFHRHEYHAAATDHKVIAHWTRRRYELATHLLAEVKAREKRMSSARRAYELKMQEEQAERSLAAKALSSENQRVVPVR